MSAHPDADAAGRRGLKSWLQGLEDGMRSRLLGLLARQPDGPFPPDWSARPRRLLYVRYDGIGDMIMSTGVLHALRQAHPALEVHVLTLPVSVPVLDGNPDVRRVIPLVRGRRIRLPAATALRLARTRYDVVVDGMVPRVSDGLLRNARVGGLTRQVAAVTRAPYRVGVAGRRGDDVYNLPVPSRREGRHHIEHTASLLAAFGIDPDAAELRPRLYLSAAERGAAEARWGADPAAPRVLVNVSANNVLRGWPGDRFRELLAALHQRMPAARAAVIGAPADATLCERVGAAHAEVVRTGSLREALALVATADLLVTPDTSLVHAASAFGCPTLALFQHGVVEYAPWRVPARAVFAPGAALAELPAADVVAALDELLPEAAAHARGRAAGG